MEKGYNIKMLNFFFEGISFIIPTKRLLSGSGECILSKKSNYHSSSTMHSCKLWHYLCCHRGGKEKKGRAGAQMREGVKSKENGVVK